METLKNPYVIFIAATLAVTVIGFLRSYSIYNGTNIKLEYLRRFRNLFVDWCNGNFEDRQLYTSLIWMSPKAQANMGKWGITAYKPPFANFMHTNWPIILNAIPLIKQHADDGFRSSLENQFAQMVDDALVRTIGDFESRQEVIRSEIRNPIKLFSVGISFIITFPLFLIAEFGLISISTYNLVSNSFLTRAATFTVALAGFISAVVTIAIGWDQVKAISLPYLYKIMGGP